MIKKKGGEEEEDKEKRQRKKKRKEYPGTEKRIPYQVYQTIGVKSYDSDFCLQR